MILISNNSELAAKYLPNNVNQSIRTLEIQNINTGLAQGLDLKFDYQQYFQALCS